MSEKYTKPVCKGSFKLGTACGYCERCKERIDDKRARETEAYKLGVEHNLKKLTSPNPYAQESQEWLDFEFGWGEAEKGKGMTKRAIMALGIVSSPKQGPYTFVQLDDGEYVTKPVTRQQLLNLIMDAARAVGNMDQGGNNG